METVHFHFETLDSTNAWAKQNIGLFERHKLTLISAGSQINGRGQYGRTWISPSDTNIYASYCFFIDYKKQDPLSITHVLAISICEFLKKEALSARIKWPNDVKINDKKIAGILCETVYFGEEFGVVVGMGLNVNMTAEVIQTIDQPATSLFAEKNLIYDTQSVLNHVTDIFSIQLGQFLQKGFAPFHTIFKELKI